MSGTAGQSAAMGGAMSGDDLGESDVRKIQQARKDAGHDVEVDGDWGDETRQALRDYQEEKNLGQSGDLDRQTIAELGVDVDARGTQQAENPMTGSGSTGTSGGMGGSTGGTSGGTTQ
jgi:peptidoglycan hydrolase-like protein with peptidoglycan-binding domain